MPFPAGWPPRRQPQSGGCVRFMVEGVSTALFSDSAYLFVDGTDASPWTPLPYVRPGGEATVATVSQYSGGGTNDQTDPANPKPLVWAQFIRIVNSGANMLEISFDGVHVHGKVEPGLDIQYQRTEAGIAVRGAATTFRIEAW